VCYLNFNHAQERNETKVLLGMTMVAQLSKTTGYAVCIDNSNYPEFLEQRKIYRVLPDEDAAVDGDVRVIDESGEDYLYLADRFVPISVPRVVKDSWELNA
jgi:hypothetical protein